MTTNVTFSGPLFDQPTTALVNQIKRAFIRHLFEIIGQSAARALRDATPAQTGRLRRSLWVRYERRGPSIVFGYTYPARYYWHFAGRGSWPREFDRIVFNAVRAAIPEAGRRALRDVLG